MRMCSLMCSRMCGLEIMLLLALAAVLKRWKGDEDVS